MVANRAAIGGTGVADNDYAVVLDDAGMHGWNGPRAVYHKELTLFSFVGNNVGSGAAVGAYDHTTNKLTTFQLRDNYGNDHFQPVLHVRADGKIVAAYARHNDTNLWVRISSAAEDISAWDDESVVATGNITHPQFVHLSGEGDPTDGRLYLFYRQGSGFTDRARVYRTSDDGGETWSAEQTLINDGGEHPYLMMWTDGVDQIHFQVSDSNPETYADNSVYHLHYDAGTWRDSAGNDLGSPGFGVGSLTQVYDGSGANDRAWVGAVAVDSGTPVMVFPTYPSTSDHRFHYAAWNSGTSSWDVNEFVAAGPGISTLGYAFGGLTLDPTAPGTVYLSRQVSGTYEIEKWTTTDFGSSFTSEALTGGSTDDQLRPVTIAGAETRLAWMTGTFTDLDNYDTSIVLAPSVVVASNAGDYDAAVNADSPVAYWKLDGMSGAVVDETGSHNGATSGVMGLIPQSSGAFDFDGIDDDVEVTYHADLNPSQFSVEAWFNADTGAGRIASNHQSNTNNGWDLYRNTAGGADQLAFLLRNSGTINQIFSDVGSVDAGRTYHVVATYDGTTARLYIDGRLVASDTVGFTPNTAENFKIGNRAFGSRYWDGRIDNVSLYSSALSATQVETHLNAGRP